MAQCASVGSGLFEEAGVAVRYSSSNNISAYKLLNKIRSRSTEGFYLVLASPRMQNEITRRYVGERVKVFDFIKEKENYRFSHVVRFLEEEPGADAYFFLQMQEALKEDDDIHNLNFSRDMLARERKNIIFCMTRRMYERVIKVAHDWHAFIKLRVEFEDEFEDRMMGEGQMIESERYRPDDSSTGETFEVDFSIGDNRLLSQAISLTHKAEDLLKEYRYQDALAALDAVRRIRERVLGIDDPDTTGTYNSIADVYYEMGKFSQALEYDQKTLAIREKVLPPDHPDLAKSYNSIGVTYSDLGRNEEALDYYRKALAIREKVLPPDHPDLAVSYNNIGVTYAALGRNEDALDYYRKALCIFEKSYPSDHPFTERVKKNIFDLTSIFKGTERSRQ